MQIITGLLEVSHIHDSKNRGEKCAPVCLMVDVVYVLNVFC